MSVLVGGVVVEVCVAVAVMGVHGCWSAAASTCSCCRLTLCLFCIGGRHGMLPVVDGRGDCGGGGDERRPRGDCRLCGLWGNNG